jgi:TolB-like protein/Flp pilus assembly protein TadD
MGSKPSFFAELKRRNVLRAGALYVGAVWALAQGIVQLGPILSLPAWAAKWFLVAAAIGFPVYLAFAWFYELTPGGTTREGEGVAAMASARRTARKWDFWIVGVMALALVLLLADRFVVHHEPAQSVASPEKSVAVLPLANESGDSANDYFVDGLSEQLISDLSRLEELKVIGRSSSFRFRGSQESLEAIGARLGVAHLVEGTVRQSGERVRVVVGLVRAADGSSVWSQSYDRELKDIFDVQADIAKAVATALQVKLIGAQHGTGEMPPSGNIEAYQAMMQARALRRQGTESAIRHAISLLEKALCLDPGYAFALAGLSNCWLDLGNNFLKGAEKRQAYAEGRRLADEAFALAPDLPVTHVIRAAVLRQLDLDHVGALAAMHRAVALAPGDGLTVGNLADQVMFVGDLQQAVDLFRKAIAVDPLRADWYTGLADALTAQGRLDEAEQALQSAQALQPALPGIYLQFSTLAILRGEDAAALRYAEQETDPVTRDFALAQARQIAGDRQAADAALQGILAQYGEDYPYAVAKLYALRKQPDAMFEWLDRARAAREWTLIRLLADPFILAYRHDPRFAAFCKKMGLSVPAAAGGAATPVARAGSRS